MSDGQTVSLPSVAPPALPGKLKVLVVCLSHSWGGLEQVAAQDVLALQEQAAVGTGDPVQGEAAQVTWMGFAGSPFLAACCASQPSLPSLGSSLGVIHPGWGWQVTMIRALHLLIGRFGVNLVHAHQPSLLKWLVPALWGCPSVGLVVSRHIWNQHLKKNSWHAFLYQRVDALLVMSHALRANVLATHAIACQKVQVVTLGLDLTKFDPQPLNRQAVRAAFFGDRTSSSVNDPADSGLCVIGMVGRLDPAKGVEVFLRAAIQLLQDGMPQQKNRLLFVIVGEKTRTAHATASTTADGTYLQSLKALAQAGGIASQVRFLGFQAQVPALMHALDLLVMPSDWETFGLVAIEAMAMECPVIVAEGGSYREIIGENEWGWSFPAQDAGSLALRMQQVCSQAESSRRLMGQRARARVQAVYSQERRQQQTFEVYRQLLLLRQS